MLRPLVGEQLASFMVGRKQNRTMDLLDDSRNLFLRVETPSKDHQRDFVPQYIANSPRIERALTDRRRPIPPP